MDYAKALQTLNEKTKAKPMVILSHRSIDKASAVMLVQFPGGMGSPELAAEVTKDVFEGQIVTIPGTYRPREDKQFCLAEISVRSIPVSKPMAEIASMQAVTATTYMDDTTSLWNVVGEGEGRRIVRSAPENLSAILAARHSRLHGVKNEIAEVAAQVGDFVLYVTGLKSDLGVVVEETAGAYTIYSPKAIAPLSIVKAAVLEAAPVKEVMKQLGGNMPETASDFSAEPYTTPTDGSRESLVKMLSQIFALNPEMVEKLHSLMGA